MRVDGIILVGQHVSSSMMDKHIKALLPPSGGIAIRRVCWCVCVCVCSLTCWSRISRRRLQIETFQGPSQKFVFWGYKSFWGGIKLLNSRSDVIFTP